MTPQKTSSPSFAGYLLAVAMLTASCSIFNDDDPTADLDSPLSQHVGFDRLDLDFRPASDLQAQIEATETSRQQAIAECMVEQGYEYAIAVESNPNPTELDSASREYAARYGFGVTTQAFSQDQVGPHLVGYPTKDQTAGPPNPNLAIVNALSPTERAAYFLALTGRVLTSPPDQPITADQIAGSADAGGCQREASVYRSGQERFYQEFGHELEALRQQVLRDPRALEHEQTIRDCVTNQGLAYVAPDRLYEHWSDELTAINDSIAFQSGGSTAGLPELSAEAKARLITIQNEETELALAVHDCGGDPETRSDLYTQIAYDHERQFIDQHRDRLDAFNDSNNP